MSNPVVLITGALTGIGRATAAAFAKDGAQIAAHIRGDEFRLGTRTAKLGCKRFPLGLVAAGDDAR